MRFDWRAVPGVHIDSGDGARADYRFFRYQESLWQGSSVHENPRYFKVRWKIWTAADLPENAEQEDQFDVLFRMAETPYMCFSDAMARAKQLYTAGEPFLIHSYAFKRRGDDTPWDEKRLEDAACPYDEDTDPEFHGYR